MPLFWLIGALMPPSKELSKPVSSDKAEAADDRDQASTAMM